MEIFDYTISFLDFQDVWMIGTVLFCFLVMLDDIFVDVLAILSGSKPYRMDSLEFKKMNTIPEKKIAIMIANWHEDAVLERMVAGNVNNIEYKNYEILLGVYPNDTATLNAARRSEKKFANVRVIVNMKNGPTSKGQMINRMVSYIDQFNKFTPNNAYDLVVIQDAEDVIHKYSLKLMNLRSADYDFIQIPVFSLDLPLSKLTAGVYIDEFTESHTKDLLVRDCYGGGVPSAGVGTVVSTALVNRLLKLQDGHFLSESTLTEDYYLGLTCYDLKVKSHFSCEYFEIPDSKTGKLVKEYIATREFFPQKVRASIKQKTRWSLGICLQSLENKRKKRDHFFGNYFLWRDRKGMISVPLFISATLFTLYFLSVYLYSGNWPILNQASYYDYFIGLMWANLILSVTRIFQRGFLVYKIYGLKMAMLVPPRWVLSNFINTSALLNAVYQWTRSKISGKAPAWSKTDHVIPAGFGEGALSVSMADLAPARLPLVPMPVPPKRVTSNELSN